MPRPIANIRPTEDEISIWELVLEQATGNVEIAREENPDKRLELLMEAVISAEQIDDIPTAILVINDHIRLNTPEQGSQLLPPAAPQVLPLDEGLLARLKKGEKATLDFFDKYPKKDAREEPILAFFIKYQDGIKALLATGYLQYKHTSAVRPTL